MPATSFLTEPEPEAERNSAVGVGISRIVANNPSMMTYHGTNTYLLQTHEGVYVIDPGPVEDRKHFTSIVASVGDGAAGILITHHHSDHFGAAPMLRDELGIPIFVSSAFPDDAFEPDGFLKDGQTIAGLTVLHTPGHASDHLCFARSDGVLFSGDHVMSWNSTIVNPPDGNMRDYCEQLHRLIARNDRIYLPGHGPALHDPKLYVERLLGNRMRREAEILAHLSAAPDTIPRIAAAVYQKSDPHIAKAAERNVLAHLEKLQSDAKVAQSSDFWRAIY